MVYVLDELKYEINGCVIDKTRFVGITTTLKIVYLCTTKKFVGIC